MHEPSICVIVCVHDALVEVRQCLAAVRASDYPAGRIRLVVVDDGSGPETKSFLKQSIAAGDGILLRHDEARGYTAAANAGLRARGDADFTVLLNSDAIVPPLWLRHMLLAFDKMPDAGIVGPLSNAATWQSIPDYRNETGGWAINELPLGWPVERMDALVNFAFQAKPRLPRVPVLNGFCLMVRATVFDQIGLLDEAAFPRGYGEENDFCFRAADAGFGLVVATNCYVYHAKSKSYGSATRNELAAAGTSRLRERYGAGRLSRASETMKVQPVLAEIRTQIGRSLYGDWAAVRAAAPAAPGLEEAGALAAPPPVKLRLDARGINAAIHQLLEEGVSGVHEVDGNISFEVLEPQSEKHHRHIQGSLPENAAIEESFFAGPVLAIRALDSVIDTTAGLTLIEGGVLRGTAVTSQLIKRYQAPNLEGVAPDPHSDALRVPLASQRMTNYCRWWLDSIGKVFVASRAALARTEDGLPPPEPILPALSETFQQEAVAFLQPVRAITTTSEPFVRGRSLNSPGLCYGGGQRIGAMVADFAAFLRDVPMGAPQSPGAGRRVYISRNAARFRRVLNEDDVLPAIRALGFTVVRLEDLTLSDQIRTFRDADIIVSPHGAGLTNILFCRPGTTLVEIFPEGGVHGSAFLRTASHIGLLYYFVVAQAAGRVAPKGNGNDSDMVFEPDALIGFLGEVLRSPQADKAAVG